MQNRSKIFKRGLAFFIDINLSALVYIFLDLIPILREASNLENLAFYLSSGLFVFKDVMLRNQSIGKNIVGLMVISTEGNLSTIELILRNILLLLWPIEMILVLLNKKRIGDIIFKMDVVLKETEG